jgi:hypothetical protein
LFSDLFRQLGENKGARGPFSNLKYYVVVACRGAFVFTFAPWNVTQQVINFVTNGLGGDDMLTLQGGHAREDFEVCNNGARGI